MGIDTDARIEGLKRFTDLIQRFGAEAIVLFNHPGRMANPKLPWNFFMLSTSREGSTRGCIQHSRLLTLILNTLQLAAVEVLSEL